MLLYLLFKVAFLAVLMACLTAYKYSVLKSAAIIAASHFVIWIGNYLIYIYLGGKIFDNISLFTIGIPGYICFSLVSKYKGFKLLFTFLTVTIFGTLASFIGKLVDLNYSNFLMQSGVKFLSFLLIAAFVVKAYRESYLKLQQILDKGWGLLCLIPLLMINVLCLLMYYPAPIQVRPQNIPVIILVYVVNFVFYAILCINFENIWQLLQFKRDRGILAVHIDMYKKQYEMLSENIQTMKIYRHDMLHHLSAIDGFLSDKNPDEAQKYIRQLDGGLTKATLHRYCENYVVNVMLSSYIQKAENEQIKVCCEGNISEDINIDPIEIGIIFANSLDNAIKACIKIEDPKERKIHILFKEHCGQIYIRTSNPYTSVITFDGEFPVSEDPEHGNGTRSIAAIAAMHGGIFSFTAQNGVFNMTVTLKC